MLVDLPHDKARPPLRLVHISECPVAGPLLWRNPIRFIVTPQDVLLIKRLHGHVIEVSGLKRA